jgi:crotonobetainyl-CoA:carnitine CoA-transferase CaiB-like acyl-CoA transferase
MTGGPLEGVLVVDLTRALAGPHATMMLADQGARVIKVEAPGSGDDTRQWGPPFVSGADGEQYSTYFLSCNRNKESITLDLKSEAGAATLLKLVRRADVLAENFRPGVLDRLGFGVARLQAENPGLVILSITGFGHDGPEGGRAGYDQISQGEAGLMSLTGPSPDEPAKAGYPVTDVTAGMYGAFGVVCALNARARTGRGTVVRTSLLAAAVGIHAYQGTRYTVAGEVPDASGAHHPSICPYGLFRAADDAIQIAVGSDRQWQAFAAAFGLGRPDWGRNADRVADRDAVISAVNAAFAGLGLDELMKRLDLLGIPAGRIRSLEEVYQWEQTRSQGLLLEVDHPALGKISLPGPPVRYDDGGRDGHLPPPLLGQHDEEVSSWLEQDAAPEGAR